MKQVFYKGRFIFFPLIAIAFISLISLIVMQLWNHLLPDILHTGTIDFWQAMGLFILCKILFGFGKGGRAPWMRRGMMNERLKNMDPEEREKFKEKMEHWKCWKGRDWDSKPVTENKQNTENI